MERVKGLPIMVLMFVLSGFSSSSFADLSDQAEAVLPPGARIVAGNPNKNEFYIVADNDSSQAKNVPHQIVQANANKQANSDSKLAANKNASGVTTKSDIAKIELALNQVTDRAIHQAGKKMLAPPLTTTAALHQSKHKLASVNKHTNTHKHKGKTVALNHIPSHVPPHAKKVAIKLNSHHTKSLAYKKSLSKRNKMIVHKKSLHHVASKHSIVTMRVALYQPTQKIKHKKITHPMHASSHNVHNAISTQKIG